MSGCREFWVRPADDLFVDVIDDYEPEPSKWSPSRSDGVYLAGFIHVIEYSAFESMLKENAQLRKALGKPWWGEDEGKAKTKTSEEADTGSDIRGINREG